jgi:predicted dienelactone hydrolase
MALVGAEWSLRDLIRHCLAAGEADLGFCYNGLPDEAARAARRARFESARNVPDFLLGRENNARHGGRDPRIAVVAVSIPVGAIFRADSLAQIAVPVGVVRAEADRLTPNAFHAERLLRYCGACTPLAVMVGAGHMDAMSPWPSSVAKAVAERYPVGGRPEPGFDPAERTAAQAAIVQHFVRHLAP